MTTLQTPQLPPPAYEQGAHPTEPVDVKDEVLGWDDDSDDNTSTAGAPSTLYSGSQAVDAGGPPSEFNIYKKGGVSMDSFVTGPSKDDVLYYCDHPRKLSGAFRLTITKGSETGPVLATCDKAAITMTMYLESVEHGWKTDIKQDRFLKRSLHLTSPSGAVWRWKRKAKFSTNWLLLNESQNNDVIATWRRADFAKRKDGQLHVSALYAKDTDFVITTALCMDEWCRWQETRVR